MKVIIYAKRKNVIKVLSMIEKIKVETGKETNYYLGGKLWTIIKYPNGTLRIKDPKYNFDENGGDDE